jgi:hypothetical protein
MLLCVDLVDGRLTYDEREASAREAVQNACSEPTGGKPEEAEKAPQRYENLMFLFLWFGIGVVVESLQVCLVWRGKAKTFAEFIGTIWLALAADCECLISDPIRVELRKGLEVKAPE